VYGDVDALRTQAKQRVETLKSLGHTKANLYGDTDILGGLNVFYLLLDEPELYGQPVNPQLPQKNLIPGSILSIGTSLLLGLSAIVAFRNRGQRAANQNGKGA
jgi:formate dehydrogenase iron-sulfur subunit